MRVMVAVYSLPLRVSRNSNRKGKCSTRNTKPPSASTQSSRCVLNPYKLPKSIHRNKSIDMLDKVVEESSAAEFVPSKPSSPAKESAADTLNQDDEDVVEVIDHLLTHLHVNSKGECRDFEYDLLYEYTEDMHAGLSESSGRLYTRYQNLWKSFCIKCHVAEDNEFNEAHLVSFFTQLKHDYKPSTMWVVYSCVNQYFRRKHGKNLKALYKLQSFLKNSSSRCVSKKSKVFTPEQMHSILMVCQDAQDDTNLTLMGVGSALLYFGLLP